MPLGDGEAHAHNIVSDVYIRVESEIKYRPSFIIGRVYKICALLGQLLLAPKCSPKSTNLGKK